MSYKAKIQELILEWNSSVLKDSLKDKTDNTPYKDIGHGCFDQWVESIDKENNPKLKEFRDWLGEDYDFSRFYTRCAANTTLIEAIYDYLDDVYSDNMEINGTEAEVQAFYEKYADIRDELLRWAHNTDAPLVIIYIPDSDHDT